MLPGLTERLSQLIRTGTATTYGALAKDLDVAPLSRLTEALESLMEEDAAKGHPFRAALVCARLTPDLPAPGFFDRAAALGRYHGEEPRDYVAQERAALQSRCKA
ncbi:hypothetical protein NX862_03320 [Rhodobacter sp. KR11]|uniref:hypothetical protein n=1 Tax=Rhodobacter sp. KR11 TaxID=2974588 RepID=UPI0022222649|nr:hypothetical protein [Rhodobacter sp. KR11]MCW1917771.1 hypothetical protein [Rhodobacter sp. KR11]